MKGITFSSAKGTRVGESTIEFNDGQKLSFGSPVM